MTGAVPADAVEVLAIKVAGEDFAFDLASVKEVIRPPVATAVPDLPAYVSGLINFRGVSLPVIDLKARFQAAVAPPPGDGRISAERLVICAVRPPDAPDGSGTADKVVAFQVDAASEIVRVPRAEVLSAVDAELRGVVRGIVPRGDRRFVWLDAAALVASDLVLPLARLREAEGRK